MSTRDRERRMQRAGLAIVAALAAASAVEAHHSIAAAYDGSRQQRVEGVVAEFQFVNPHPFVIVTVDGGESWRAEMDNRFELADIGITSRTLQPGDRVVVTGSLGRTQERTLYIRRLDRPADGFRYEQVGFTPRVTTVRR